MKIDLSWQVPPEPFGRPDEKGRLLCYVRRKRIQSTPEEVVRQRICRFCENHLGLEPSTDGGASRQLTVEKSINHFVGPAIGGGRAVDIVVWDRDATEADAVPQMIIECKKSKCDGSMPDVVKEQVVGYNRHVGAPQVAVADWTSFEVLRLIGDVGTKALDRDTTRLLVQSYSDLDIDHASLRSLLTGTPINPALKPTPYSRHWSESKRIDYEFYGEHGTRSMAPETPAEVAFLAAQLTDLLLDTSAANRVPAGGLLGPAAIEYDLGLRWVAPNNRSGGSWEADARSFLLESEQPAVWRGATPSVFQVNLAVVAGGAAGLPTLVVNTDYTSRSATPVNKNSLQLNLYANTIRQGDTSVVWHGGRMSRGKTADLFQYMRSNLTCAESLLQPGSVIGLPARREVVVLGALPTTRSLGLDDPLVTGFLGNCIIYALSRREFTLATQG